MRKTLAVVALTTALTGGAATTAFADDVTAAPVPAAQTAQENADDQESDKTGLWGLLGLLGLAGLIKRKETSDDTHSARR